MKTLSVKRSGDKPEIRLGTAVEKGICCCCADPLGVFSEQPQSSCERHGQHYDSDGNYHACND